MASPPRAVVDAIPGFLKDPKYSDLTLKCGGREWRVNKVIVCSQSGYFAKACDRGSKEAENNVTDLQEDDPLAVDAMITYLYTDRYNDGLGKDDGIPRLLFSVRMLIVADKYDIPALTRDVSVRLSAEAWNDWKTPAFPAAIRELFENGPARDGGMRQRLVEVSCFHSSKLLNEPYGEDFQRVVDEVPVFGRAFWEAVEERERRLLISMGGTRY